MMNPRLKPFYDLLVAKGEMVPQLQALFDQNVAPCYGCGKLCSGDNILITSTARAFCSWHCAEAYAS